MSKSYSDSGLTAKRSNRLFTAGLIVLTVVALCATSCNPEASWTTKDVTIQIAPYTVSAGYIECAFTPNEDAYYLVACVPAREGYDPLDPKNQKQFMNLALDSADIGYKEWRHDLWEEGEFNVAPFASHSLQYGNIVKFFTNLKPSTDYWIYAFVVDPVKEQPAGKLYLKTISTPDTSVVDVHFEYRVKGLWDFIYPLNPDDKINSHFPYLAATVDSLTLAVSFEGISPEDFFNDYFTDIAKDNRTDEVRYGVNVVKNDGSGKSIPFVEGHTFYTAIVSFDGFIGNNVIYKFTWTGEDFEAYFKDEDSIVSDGEDD